MLALRKRALPMILKAAESAPVSDRELVPRASSVMLMSATLVSTEMTVFSSIEVVVLAKLRAVGASLMLATLRVKVAILLRPPISVAVMLIPMLDSASKLRA